MTVQDGFSVLSRNLGHLDEALAHLEWAIVSSPPQTVQAPVSELYDQVAALRGWLSQAQSALGSLRLSSPAATRLAPARQALVKCQEYFSQVLAAYYGELAVPAVVGTLQELMRAPAAGGREAADSAAWAGWAYGVRDALDSCATPIDAVNQALTQCWRELADHADPPSVLIHANSIPSLAASGEEAGGANSD